MDGVCDFFNPPTSLGAITKGGRQIAATSLYKSNVWAAVYLKCNLKEQKLENLIKFGREK